MSTQTTGLALLAIGGTLLWSPWALVVAGILLLIVPEVAAATRQRRAKVAYLQAAARDRGQAAVLPT